MIDEPELQGRPSLGREDEICRSATALRAASRVIGLPREEQDRLRLLDQQECRKLLDDPVRTLRWAVETLASTHHDETWKSHVLFAIRAALAADLAGNGTGPERCKDA